MPRCHAHKHPPGTLSPGAASKHTHRSNETCSPCYILRHGVLGQFLRGVLLQTPTATWASGCYPGCCWCCWWTRLPGDGRGPRRGRVVRQQRRGRVAATRAAAGPLRGVQGAAAAHEWRAGRAWAGLRLRARELEWRRRELRRGRRLRRRLRQGKRAIAREVSEPPWVHVVLLQHRQREDTLQVA